MTDLQNKTDGFQSYLPVTCYEHKLNHTPEKQDVEPESYLSYQDIDEELVEKSKVVESNDLFRDRDVLEFGNFVVSELRLTVMEYFDKVIQPRVNNHGERIKGVAEKLKTGELDKTEAAEKLLEEAKSLSDSKQEWEDNLSKVGEAEKKRLEKELK